MLLLFLYPTLYIWQISLKYTNEGQQMQTNPERAALCVSEPDEGLLCSLQLVVQLAGNAGNWSQNHHLGGVRVGGQAHM